MAHIIARVFKHELRAAFRAGRLCPGRHAHTHTHTCTLHRVTSADVNVSCAGAAATLAPTGGTTAAPAAVDVVHSVKAQLAGIASHLVATRLDLHDATVAPAAAADLKLRIHARFPGALNEAEWQTAHCVWNTLPRPCRRMCVSIAAPMSSLNIDFTTSVRAHTAPCRAVAAPPSRAAAEGLSAPASLTPRAGRAR